MIRMMAVAALALAAACGGAGAAPQEGPAPQQGAGELPGGLRGGSAPNVFALLGARQQLSLTSAQVTVLDSIGRTWSVRNDSLQRQLGDRGADRTDLTVVRPLLERMAANNQEANGAIESVLNAEQRRIACTLQPPQGPERRVPPPSGRVQDGGRRPGGFGGPGGRMGPGRPGEPMPQMQARRGWPWCSAPAAADSAARR